MMNLTFPLRELAGDHNPEVHHTSSSLMGHSPLRDPAGRKEAGTALEREIT
jgi:hypothetical protein